MLRLRKPGDYFRMRGSGQAKSLKKLLDALDRTLEQKGKNAPFKVKYPSEIEEAIALAEPEAKRLSHGKINSRWLALKLLDGDPSLIKEVSACLGEDFIKNPALFAQLMQELAARR